MSEHGLLEGSRLDEELASLHTAFDQAKTDVKETEKQLREVNRSLRLLGQYYRTKKVYQAYRKSSSKKSYLEEHRSELELYDAAVKELRSIYSDNNFPTVKELTLKKENLIERKAEQYKIYYQIKRKHMEIEKLIRNRDSFLVKSRDHNQSVTDKS